MNNEIFEEYWWLMASSFPNLNWARMRVLSSTKVDVLDMDGNYHEFLDIDSARMWLLEDEFVEFKNIDSEDEIEYGIVISEIVVPNADSEVELVKQMYVAENA